MRYAKYGGYGGYGHHGGLPDRDSVNRIREQYPPGTRIRLNHMEDPQGVPAGTEGTVLAVDGIGQLIMEWDNGRSLSVIPGVDSFSKLPKLEEQQIGGMTVGGM